MYHHYVRMSTEQCEMKVNSKEQKTPRGATWVHSLGLPEVAQGGVEVVHALLGESIPGGVLRPPAVGLNIEPGVRENFFEGQAEAVQEGLPGDAPDLAEAQHDDFEHLLFSIDMEGLCRREPAPAKLAQIFRDAFRIGPTEPLPLSPDGGMSGHAEAQDTTDVR